MKIAQSKTRTNFPLSPKKIIKKTINSFVGWVLLVGFILMLIPIGKQMWVLFMGPQKPFWFHVTPLIIAVSFLFIAVATIFSYFYERWYYAVYFYDLTDDHIIIKKNPITPFEIIIPYEKIQDVYVSQDLLDRAFGLYDVYISSATITSGMMAHIDGVEKESAEGLRKILLQKIQEKVNLKKA